MLCKDLLFFVRANPNPHKIKGGFLPLLLAEKTKTRQKQRQKTQLLEKV